MEDYFLEPKVAAFAPPINMDEAVSVDSPVECTLPTRSALASVDHRRGQNEESRSSSDANLPKSALEIMDVVGNPVKIEPYDTQPLKVFLLLSTSHRSRSRVQHHLLSLLSHRSKSLRPRLFVFSDPLFSY